MDTVLINVHLITQVWHIYYIPLCTAEKQICAFTVRINIKHYVHLNASLMLQLPVVSDPTWNQSSTSERRIKKKHLISGLNIFKGVTMMAWKSLGRSVTVRRSSSDSVKRHCINFREVPLLSSLLLIKGPEDVEQRDPLEKKLFYGLYILK